VDQAEKLDRNATPFSAKKQPSNTSKEAGNVYKNGFFVHKTIRDLAIKPDLKLSLPESSAGPGEESQMRA